MIAFSKVIHIVVVPITLDIYKNTIIKSKIASFFEHVFPCKFKKDSSLIKQTHEAINEDSEDQEQEEIQDSEQEAHFIYI